MIKTIPITILDCPDALQAEIQKRLAEPDCEICSVTVTVNANLKL